LQNIWRLSETINFVKDIDPKTGALIGRVDPPIGQTTHLCPMAAGARSWNPGAYNPKTGLWYTDVMEICSALTPIMQKTDPKEYGTPHIGSENFGKFQKVAGYVNRRAS
jgi:alcohol dehydrogenase (cytochrome c)